MSRDPHEENRPQRRYWRDFLARFTMKLAGLLTVEKPEEQLDLVHALRGATFFQDIRRQQIMVTSQPDDSASVVPYGKSWNNRTIMAPRALTTLNQLPSFFWSVPEWRVLNATAGLAITSPVPIPAPPAVAEVLTKHAVIRVDPRNQEYIAFTFDWWNGAGTNPVIGPPPVGMLLGAGDTQVLPIENLAWIRTIASMANQYYSITYIPDQGAW